jgi:hypothetical protein
MQPWYLNERLRIAAIAIAAGVILGGLVVLAVGHPKLTRFGQPQKSTADAIASDQPAVRPRTKPKAKKAKARPARKVHKARRSRGSAAAAPDPTATPDAKRDDETDTAAVPQRRAASRRVTARPHNVISAPRRRTATSKPSPDPTPAAPAPASTPASTPAPTPAPTQAPRPAKGPKPDNPGLGHGNGVGGDDDVPPGS